MEKFQRVICKLAETHPNAPLTPAARTFLLDRLSQFGSEYKTPDHPPYSAMIERAISELNEKRGSSEESISSYLKKEYNNLPWAHSTILKHHLQNLCASSFIVLTRKKRYKLPSKIKLPITNSSGKEVNRSEIEFPIINSSSKRKVINETKRKRTRWHKHKRGLIKLKYKGRIVAVIEKNKEYDNKEYDELDEVTLLQTKDDDVNAVRAPEQPGGQQSKKSPRFQSPWVDTTELPVEVNLKQQEIGNPDTTELEVNLKQQEIGNPDTTELPVEVNLKQQESGNPDATELPVEVNLKQQEIGNLDTTELPVEVNSKQQEIVNPDTTELPVEVNLKQQEIVNPVTTELPVEVNLKQQEIVNPDTTELPVEVNLKQQEIGLSEIMDDDVSAAHTQEQSEHTWPETSNPTDFELPRVENLPNPELTSELSLPQSEYSQPEIPSFELPRLKNLNNLGPLQLPSEVNLLQQETGPSEITKPDFTAAHRVQKLHNPAPTQLEPKELFDSERSRRQLRRWMQRHLNQGYSGTKSVREVVENDVKSAGTVEKYSRRETVPKQPESPRLCNPQVTPDADYTEPPSQHYTMSEPISSDPINFSIRVSSQQQEIGSPDITYRRRSKMNPKQSEIIVTDEKEPRQLSKEQRKEISQDKQPQPRRSLRLRSSKPEIINVDENHVISLPPQTDCLKSEPSKEKSVNQKRASKPMNLDDGGAEAEKSSTQHVGRPQQVGKLPKRGRGRPPR